MIPKIAILIASAGLCKAEFAVSLANLTAFFNMQPLEPEIKKQKMKVFLAQSALLPYNQHLLVKAAQQWGATHALWLEDDMEFPADSLHQLWQRKQAWVGANYPKRTGPPFAWVAPTQTGIFSEGVEAVDYTGYGVTLMDMEVFNKVPEPWFETPYQEDGSYWTTDMSFAKKAREQGIQPYVDQDLSKTINHIGYKTYTNQEAYEWVTNG